MPYWPCFKAYPQGDNGPSGPGMRCFMRPGPAAPEPGPTTAPLPPPGQSPVSPAPVPIPSKS